MSSKQKRRYPTRSSGGLDNQYESPEGSKSTTKRRSYSGSQPAEGSGEDGKFNVNKRRDRLTF